MPHLTETIKHKGKIYREAGFFYADAKAYRSGDHIILIEPDGSIFHSYTIEENYSREM